MAAPLARAPTQVKMSVLARLSGVPAATIKHYVNAGLLPEPTRTGRNMAYYDVSTVERVQRIKELQRTRFLPLKVIRDVLDGVADDDPDETVAASIARVLSAGAESDRRSRAELERAGLPRKQLDWLLGAGLVRADDDGTFSGDDLALLRLLGAARKAGLDPEMLPLEVLGDYAQALSGLVRAELQLFRRGVLPRAGDKLPELTEAATELSEKLVVLLRRKMLLPTLEALVREATPPASAKTKPSTKTKTSAKTPAISERSARRRR